MTVGFVLFQQVTGLMRPVWVIHTNNRVGQVADTRQRDPEDRADRRAVYKALRTRYGKTLAARKLQGLIRWHDVPTCEQPQVDFSRVPYRDLLK